MKWTLVVLAASLTAAAQTVPLPCESTRQTISPTGAQALVRCKDDTTRLVDLPSGKEVRSLHAKSVSTMQFSTDGKFAALASDDGTTLVFATSGGATPIHLPMKPFADDVQFLPGNKTAIVSVHMNGGEVWDISAAPKKIATLTSDFDGFSSMAVSNDGKLLAACGADTVVRLWHTDSWNSAGEYRGYLLEPFTITFSADDKWLFVGGADKQITVVDVASAREIRKLPAQPDPVEFVGTLDADHIAASYFDEDGRKPPHIMVWDLKSGSAQPVAVGKAMTGGGIVRGKLWLVNSKGKDMEMWLAE